MISRIILSFTQMLLFIHLFVYAFNYYLLYILLTFDYECTRWTLLQKLTERTKLYTVKPVLRGHLWDKDKVVIYKTGDPLKEVQFK